MYLFEIKVEINLIVKFVFGLMLIYFYVYDLIKFFLIFINLF